MASTFRKHSSSIQHVQHMGGSLQALIGQLDNFQLLFCLPSFPKKSVSGSLSKTEIGHPHRPKEAFEEALPRSDTFGDGTPPQETIFRKTMPGNGLLWAAAKFPLDLCPSRNNCWKTVFPNAPVPSCPSVVACWHQIIEGGGAWAVSHFIRDSPIHG